MSDAAMARLPDRATFWRWVLASLRPVAGWLFVAGGGLMLLVGWVGVSREVLVAKQLPYLVSGGFGGLGMIVLGARLLVSEDLRSYDGRLRRMEDLVDDLHLLLLVERPPSEQASATERGSTPVEPSLNGNGVVVLERGSSFHRPDCRLVRDKGDSELLLPGAAEDRGMKPCGVCHPPVTAVAAASMEQ